MVCRHSLKLDLDVSLHGSAKGAALLAFSVDVDLVLDILNVLFGTHPGWPGSQVWEVFWVNLVRFLVTENVEGTAVRLCWFLQVNSLVEVVMDNFTKINQAALLDLNFAFGVKLQSGGVDKAQISDIVTAIHGANHELRLPELLIIWHVIVTGLSLTYFEDSSISVADNLDVLELFGVHLLKLEDEPLLRNVERLDVRESTLEITAWVAKYVIELGLSELRLI